MARRSTRKRKAIESETVKPVKPETPADRLPAPENPVAKEQPAAENADTPNKEVRKKKRRRKQKPQTATEASNVLQNDKGFLPDTTVMKDEKDEEELELEELVFGGDVEGKFDEVLRKVGHEVEVKADDDDHWAVGFESGEEGPTGDGLVESEDDEDFNFFIDTAGHEGRDSAPADREHISDSVNPNEESEQPTSADISSFDSLPPAWEDDDDVPVNIVDQKRLRKLRKDYSETVLSGREFEARLRRQYEKIHPTPQWAVIPLRDGKNGNSSDDLLSILRTSLGIVDTKAKARILNPDSLEVVRVKDANQMAYSQAVVQSVHFHPRAPVLLTGGYDRTLRLFQVDGKVNPKIQSIYIKDLPIHRAHFTPDGKEVLITGKRKFFYSYNVEAGVVQRIHGIKGRDEDNLAHSYVSPDNKYLAFLGRDGHIILLSKDTKQWIANMKMNGTVTAVDFSTDGRSMYSFGGDGQVYHWDLGTRKCVHQFYDEGCVKATTLTVSPGSQYLATGSDAGVVNLYDHQSCLSSTTPSPQKSILNLTTPITHLRFNHDSQILAMASKEKKDSLRLFHVPSRRVFKNWPTSQTPLGYVSTLDFSPGGGYLAIGNDKGKVLLYRLNAYDAA